MVEPDLFSMKAKVTQEKLWYITLLYRNETDATVLNLLQYESVRVIIASFKI